MAWTRSLATKRASSSGLRVARTFHNACARSAEPPQMTTQTGRGSGRSTTRMIQSDASVSLPSPTLSATGHLRPGDRLPRLDAAPQALGGRVAGVVQEQVGPHLLVGVHDLADQVGPDLLAVAQVRRGDQALDVEVVRVEHQADERLAVVGLGDPGGQAADVRQDDQAGLVSVGGPALTDVGRGDEQDGHEESGSHELTSSDTTPSARAPARAHRAVRPEPQVTRFGVPEAGDRPVDARRSRRSAASGGSARVRPGSTRRCGPA